MVDKPPTLSLQRLALKHSLCDLVAKHLKRFNNTLIYCRILELRHPFMFSDSMRDKIGRSLVAAG